MSTDDALDKKNRPLPPGWSQHLAPSGHYYYYNSVTKKSTYKFPEAVDETPSISQPETASRSNPQIILPTSVNKTSEVDEPRSTKKRRAVRAKRDRPRLTVPLESEDAEPWVLVITRNGRRYFYNSETGKARWGAPSVAVQEAFDEIETDHLLKLIAQARGLKLDEKKEDKRWNSEAQEDENSFKNENKSENEEEDEEEEEEQEDEQLEQVEEPDQEDENPSEKNSSDNSENELADENLAWIYNADENLDLEEDEDSAKNLAAFQAMLTECGVNALGAWETEYTKVVDDERYDLLESMQARREAYESWARAEVARRRQQEKQLEELQSSVENQADEEPESMQIQIPPTDVTAQFLEFVQANFSKKKCPYYIDFKRKYRSAPEFVRAAAKLGDKDREALFRGFAIVAKKSEEERHQAFAEALGKYNANELRDKTRLPKALLHDPRFYVMKPSKRNEEFDRVVKLL